MDVLATEADVETNGHAAKRTRGGWSGLEEGCLVRIVIAAGLEKLREQRASSASEVR